VVTCDSKPLSTSIKLKIDGRAGASLMYLDFN